MGAHYNGIIGVSYGILIASVFNFIVVSIALKYYLNISIISILQTVSPVVLTFMIVFIFISMLIQWFVISKYILIALTVLCVIALYSLFLKKEVSFLKAKLFNNKK